MRLILNKPMCDWITITSYDKGIYEKYRNIIEGWNADIEKAKIRRYEGYKVDTGRGTISAMIGKQGEHDHYLVTITSEIAEYYRFMACGDVLRGDARCTRFDVQLTMSQNDEWSQMDLAYWVDGISKSMGYQKSASGCGGEELATVYHGSRKSDRFARIYQKQDESGGMLLRVEVQHNKKRANSAIISSCDNDDAMGGMIVERANKVGHIGLRDMIVSSIGSSEVYKVAAPMKRGRDKKAQWLIGDIIPLLTDEIRRGDDISEMLFRAFYDAIRDAQISVSKRKQ